MCVCVLEKEEVTRLKKSWTLYLDTKKHLKKPIKLGYLQQHKKKECPTMWSFSINPNQQARSGSAPRPPEEDGCKMAACNSTVEATFMHVG